MKVMLRQVRLDNGLEISFRDAGNRYFGDYHRICVVAEIICALDDDALALDDATRRKARNRFGARLSVEKSLVRMGVASGECDAVREALIDDFLRSTSVYLERADYPRLLVAGELARKRPMHRHV
jgi:hypothetical protein